MIRVLHILETIGSGGVERRRLSLAKLLDVTKYEQKIICTDADDNIPDEITAEGVEVIRIGKLKSPFHWEQHKKVQKIIDEFQPDIIHGAVFEGVTMAAINGWLKKVPVIIIEETSDPQNRSWKGNLLMKLFSKAANVVIGVSQGVTDEYLLGKLKIPNDKVKLINNGVKLPRLLTFNEIAEARRKWSINEKDFVIGSMGRMLVDSHKRFSDLITAFACFSIDKPNAKLLLVGDGPERRKYEQQVSELGIEKKVVFTGYQIDVAQFYQLMDVFVLASAWESFGLVLPEAMLCRLPVVATRVGGIKYIVQDEVTGYLVSPYQPQEITLKLNFLYNDDGLRIRMGMNGFKRAKKEFTEDIYVKKIDGLYKSFFK